MNGSNKPRCDGGYVRMLYPACDGGHVRMPYPTIATTLRNVLAGLGLLAAVGLTGCQVDIAGQTLPSPYYMSDDIQYFPPGPEFKLAREAAALKAARAEQAPQ